MCQKTLAAVGSGTGTSALSRPPGYTPPMRIFLTGGSGFVGGHLIERLARDHTVLAMARSDASAAKVASYGATPVRVDLDSIQPEQLSGVDAVVHCAAYVEEWGTRAQFWAGNVEGTTRMLEAARAAGVQRFLHIGTEAVLFDGQDLIDVDETWPYPKRQRYLYSETKAEAERRVLAANAPGFLTISLRPRMVWGPRDTSILPAILRRVRGGGWSWLDGGHQRSSTTHVVNLAHGVALALERGEGGQVYFLSDAGTRTIREFVTPLVATQGLTVPDRELPAWVARAAATVVEGIWTLFGIRKPPPMTRFATYMFSASLTIRTDKAARVLGYAPVITVEQGLAAMPVLGGGGPPAGAGPRR